MSNIYIQEPPTNGKVMLITTAGDIDIELWSKEAPKACRNFVQLCMEGYYDGTIFHRVVKDFIVQGGDPTGSGHGGESIYGQPFKDEIHTRLRFVRRGLVAMANSGPNDNGSQFFFTMGPTQELQGKHTIFGKVTGKTVYNMLKLQDCDVDHDERPTFPNKIKRTEILSNPFEDIVPRLKEQNKTDNESSKNNKTQMKGTKNFSLLSFGEEAEEDEEESVVASKDLKGKSKSSHDLIDDPKLSSVPAVDVKLESCKKKKKSKAAQKSDDDDDDENDDDNDSGDEIDKSVSQITINSPVVQSRLKEFLSHQPSNSPNNNTVDVLGNGAHVDVSVTAYSDDDQCDSCIKLRDCDCLKKFEKKKITEHRLNMQELDKNEKDLVIMGQLQACGLSKGNTTRTGDQKRHRFSYQFENESICVDCYIYINNISIKYLKNLRKHIYTNGILPRRHGNAGRAPHNALTYEDSQNIVQFIIGYADRYGMPQPAARGVTDVVPPIYLPAQDTYDSVYNKYQDVAKEMNFRGVTEPCFRNVWKQCVPHIQFVRLRTDVCHVCEKHRKSIQEAVTEDEKLQISESFAKHIQYAQLERDYYKTRCKAAEEEQKCGNLEEKKNVHYTFDFAQSVLVPGHVRQEGALYYKLPFKVNWFGILNDGKPAMYNYIFSEAQAMSVDNENSHSSSSVVSMFDHFLTMYGEGEKKCFINCDNCGGQNKNQTVIAYFCWRTMLGYHDEINLHFMQPYHARCQIDAMFGLGRQKLRKNDLDSVSQVADVLAKSCKYSNTVVYNADRSWVWRDWKTFLSGIFRSVPGVRQYFHFRFSSSNPGHVIVKKFATSEELNVRLLKRGKCVTPGNLPVRVEAAGLSPARQWYLYRNIREFLPLKYKDVTAPLPEVSESN